MRVARDGRAKLIAFGFVTRAASNGARPGRSLSSHCPFPFVLILLTRTIVVLLAAAVSDLAQSPSFMASVPHAVTVASYGAPIKNAALVRLPRAVACQRTVVRMRRW